MDAQDHVDANAPEEKAKGGRTRKRSSSKASAPTASSKRSLNLRVDDDSYKRLSIHALMRGSTVSELVMEYAQSLKEYSMPHRIGNRADSAEEQGVADVR